MITKADNKKFGRTLATAITRTSGILAASTRFIHTGLYGV